jgi:hypothetical protein
MKKLSILFVSVLALGMSFVSCTKDETSDNSERTSLADEIHVCVDKPILDSTNLLHSKLKGAVKINTKWINGETVRVKFLNGDDFVKNKVKEFASYWKFYANINFIFVESYENADIKIGFRWDGDTSSWSNLGRQCRLLPQNQPTMNFGWFNSNTSDVDFERVITHEFGHALGLVHEHQSPASNIQWNKPVVYNYYLTNNPKWTKEDVDRNIIDKYDIASTNSSNYDPFSIMQYSIPASHTLDGYSVGLNLKLSATDKVFMSKTYSYPSVLNSGMIFKFGDVLKSPNGKYTLGNFLAILNLFDENGNSLWNSTPPSGISRKKSYTFVFKMRSDGNLVATYYENNISNPVVVTSWESNTSGNPGAVLSLQNDGNLVISLNGITKWSSKYGKV